MSRPAPTQSPEHQPGVRGVTEVLREQIRSGRYACGQLPEEWVLTRELGVSRTRLRVAIGILRDEGLLDRRRGHGTFVTTQPLAYEVQESSGFTRTLAGNSIRAEHELVSAATWAMDPLTADLFGARPGVPMFTIERRTHVEGEPLAYSSYVVRGDLAPGLLDDELTRAGLDLREWISLACRTRIVSIEVDVEALVADESIAGLLDMAVGGPVLRLHRRFVTEHEAIVAFGSGVMRGDRFTFQSRVRIADPARSTPVPTGPPLGASAPGGQSPETHPELKGRPT